MTTLALAAAGCGYQQSNYSDFDAAPDSTGAGRRAERPAQDGYRWQSLYRGDVQTVAVPIFTNKDFTRGVELRLSKAVVNQLEAHSPYKVVPKERADTILEGEVVEVRQNTLSQDPDTTLPQEQLLSVTVNFLWKDLRSGRILVQRRNFEQTAAYYPTLGEGQYVGQQQAIERLALAIVQELQADW
ncbi:MAG: LPS assembly lipoprotein LptE [Tepidisphaeraceae bacterium]